MAQFYPIKLVFFYNLGNFVFDFFYTIALDAKLCLKNEYYLFVLFLIARNKMLKIGCIFGPKDTI